MRSGEQVLPGQTKCPRRGSPSASVREDLVVPTARIAPLYPAKVRRAFRSLESVRMRHALLRALARMRGPVHAG